MPVVSNRRMAARVAGAAAAAIEQETRARVLDSSSSEEDEEEEERPPKRSKPKHLDLGESAEWDRADEERRCAEEKLSRLEAASQRKEAEKAKEQAFFDGLRKTLAAKETKVAGHVRTNQEQQRCTRPFIDYLQHAGVYKTHKIILEHELRSPCKDDKETVWIDVVLIARDREKYNDVLIECKTQNWKEALGQCRVYYSWWEHPQGHVSQPNVYAYFSDAQSQSRIDTFRENHVGVLWPGCEDRMHLYQGQ